MKCFRGNSFSYVFDFMWSSNKVFKDIKIFSAVHLRPFIRYQGKNLDLFWICCFRFFLHCLVQPNQVIYFLFHIIFIIRIRLWIFWTVNQLVICMLLKYSPLKFSKMHVSWQVKCQSIGAFYLVFNVQWIYCQHL